MFEHEKFNQYSFEEIPLDRDIYLMDEKFLTEYEQMMTNYLNDPQNNEYVPVGYVSFVAARKVLANSVELSWYANVSDRFHEISIILTKENFVFCVGCWEYDEKPIVFVNGDWLNSLYARSFSVFAMVDAIGVKQYLDEDKLTTEMLKSLRDRIDALASDYPSISFISFADSLLLKSNWSVGTHDNEVSYSYAPELFIKLSAQISTIYQECLGLPTYSVITQGQNSYYDDNLLHISESKNHISLNSLGIPFAQLMDIEHTARANIRSKEHLPAEVYMDSQYYNSLSFNFEFDKLKQPKASYATKMVSKDCEYYFNSADVIMKNLRIEC
ncbi:hypothetical protein [Pseudoalteromonas sp. MEBiC 03485]|uniref:hypothetical protein n=1 Tax=Pseudoalteromonas sp. MEBiC 03485 TaxID=2571103 RepID=UPI00102137EB|nr:hypothetical protein [Pseudoalteromonas sp. MEBiC 03485]RZD22745.1 hypothetical protein EVU92_12100 [Pseudoalteromonas sp. MEBiC 03485]